MSKENRTLDFLLDNIDQEWSWRIKELDDFKTALENTKDDSTRSSLIRAGITLLYAHWEGFVKQCSYHYYNFVTTKGYKLIELIDPFIAISLRKEINEVIHSKKICIQSKAIKILINEFTKRGSFPNDLPLSTSNLTYDVFEDYCMLLGIDSSFFETKKQFINQRLVKNRNEIAHGRYLLIDIIDYYEIFKITIELIKNFKDRIENAAITEAYKRIA